VSHEVLEHVGDAKIRGMGNDLEEAFTGVTKAFAEVCGVETRTGSHAHGAEIDSEGLEPLLYDFLDRLIFVQDTDRVAVTDLQSVEVHDLEEGWCLEAGVEVKELDPSMDLRDVKAPTYSEMEVGYEDGQWRLTAVLDL